MQSFFKVLFYFRVKTVRSPFFCKKRDGNNLTESVDLESTAAHSVYDGSVMDDFDFDALLNTPQVKIGVGSGAERIADNQEADVSCLSLLDHLLTARLHELTICHHNFFPVKF